MFCVFKHFYIYKKIHLPIRYAGMWKAKISFQWKSKYRCFICQSRARKSQSAGSFSILHQTSAVGSAADIKLSDEFSNQVLNGKKSPLYEASWMNSMILSSWYTLMRSVAVTSGHSSAPACATASQVKFTKLLVPHRKKEEICFSQKNRFLLGPCQNQTPMSHALSGCVVTVSSQTIPLAPSILSITASQRANLYLTRKLTDVGQLTAVDILQPLDCTAHHPIKQIFLLMTWDTSSAFHSTSAFQDQNDNNDVASQFDQSISYVQIDVERILNLHLKDTGISQMDSVVDVLDRHLLSAFSVDRTDYTALSN